MNTRVLRAAIAAALLLTSLPLFAGSLERFLLPRTKSARAYDVAATPTHVWATDYNSSTVAKLGLDGQVLDVFAVYHAVQQIVADPVDDSVWYTSDFSLGHLSLTGQTTDYFLDLSNPGDVEDFIFGPDDHLWISFSGGMLVRVSRAGVVTKLPGFGGYDTRLAAGPDGNVWIVDRYDKTISRVTPAGARTIFTPEFLQEEPLGITAGPDGNLWFTTSYNLKRMTPAGQVTGTFALGFGGGREIVKGADGNLWLTDTSVRRFDIATGQVTWTYNPPAGTGFLWSIAASSTHIWWGSEGHRVGAISYNLGSLTAPFLLHGPEPYASASSAAHVWFTAPNENQIGRVDPNTGHAVLFTLPNADSRPLDIVAGADGMWFTEETGDRIGKINGSGVIVEFPVPTAGQQPTAIAFGPDGNFWFTLFDGDKVVRLTTAGVFTEFALPQTGCGPNALTSAADGNLWITCKTSAKVLRMTTAGVVTGTFNVQGNEPGAIVRAPDGNLWFSTWLHHFRMTPAGVMTKYDFPNAAHGMERVVGPDGALWDTNYNSIVRTTLDGSSHHYHFTPRVNGRALTKGPDANIWFSDSNTAAWFRFVPDDTVAATGLTLCYSGAGSISEQTVATFVDSDSARPLDAYDAWIEWDAGVRDHDVTIVAGETAGEFEVIGSHYYGLPALARTAKVVITAKGDATHTGQTVVAIATIPGFTLSADPTSFLREGGSGIVQVSAGAGCAWQLQANAAWITFPEGASGEGAGNVEFNVAANAPADRTATISGGSASVTITQSAIGLPQSSLYVMTPCRIVDTRYGSGPHPSSTTLEYFAPSACGISSGAKAIVANVTVVAPAASGWLSLYPGDTPWPGVSTVSYRANRTRANNVLLKLDGGWFNVMNSGPNVHYVIDVMGWFE